MKFTHSMIIMFIGNFVIQYFFMSWIMLSDTTYFTNNIGKAYLATIMGIFMVIIERMMMDHQYNVISINLYMLLFGLLAVFIYLYRYQIAINDKQYVKGMIEHHSMGILTSQEILKKTDDYNIAKLAKTILSQQSDELKVMQDLLFKLNEDKPRQ